MKVFKSYCGNAVLATLAAVCSLVAQPAASQRGYGHGFGGRWGGGFAWGNALLHGTVTGAPFSATETTETQRTLTNGTQIQNKRQSNVYRDAEGRVRIDTTVTRPSFQAGGTATTMTVSTIYDPVAGYVYRLDPTNMTAVQSPIRQRTRPSGGTAPTPPAGVQVQTQNLGTQTINGVTANGTQVATTIAAGTFGNSAAIQSVRVTWTSPALQIPVQITVSDPRFGNRSMNLTNINQAAPDPSLFLVPPGYTVTKPSMRGFPGLH